jgi:hypothetical protein
MQTLLLIVDTTGRVLGVAEWNFGADVWEDQIDIIGAEGIISFACFDHEPAVIRRGNGTEVVLDVPQPEHVHFQLVDAITQDLLLWKADPEEYRTVGPDCPSTAASALRTNAVIDQVTDVSRASSPWPLTSTCVLRLCACRDAWLLVDE